VEPFVYNQEQGLYWIGSWQERYPFVRAGFTTRSMHKDLPFGNLAYHVGDDPENVNRNRLYLCEVLGVPFHHMTCAIQPHGKEIVLVNEGNRGAGAMEFSTAIPGADGLITHTPDTLLTLFYADCVPIYFLDPVKRVVGVAHAGWRGTVQRIAVEMIGHFKEKYHTDVRDLHVAIGPSIGECCYQVDERVADEVLRVLGEESEQVLIPDGLDHYRLNLQKMNQILLEKAGILSQHIEVSQLCTACNQEHFFSYRKEGGKTGRMAAFVVLAGACE
jgi:YfiH family protein